MIIRPPAGAGDACTYTGSCVRLSTTEAYVLTAFSAPAVTRIVSTWLTIPPKRVVSGSCWKLFAASPRLVRPTRLPEASNNSSLTLTGAALRLTRPTFVRNAASDSRPVRYVVDGRSAGITPPTAWPYEPAVPSVNVRLDTRKSGDA